MARRAGVGRPHRPAPQLPPRPQLTGARAGGHGHGAALLTDDRPLPLVPEEVAPEKVMIQVSAVRAPALLTPRGRPGSERIARRFGEQPSVAGPGSALLFRSVRGQGELAPDPAQAVGLVHVPLPAGQGVVERGTVVRPPQEVDRPADTEKGG
jgi:hypothetical protein